MCARTLNEPVVRRRYDRAVVPRPKHELARDHLSHARLDLEQDDDRDALNALFYSAEAAIVSLAAVHGIDTRQNHRLKAEAADELAARGILEAGVGTLLRELNQARKDVWYEGEEPDLGRSLEDVADDVEALVEVAEQAHG